MPPCAKRYSRRGRQQESNYVLLLIFYCIFSKALATLLKNTAADTASGGNQTLACRARDSLAPVDRSQLARRVMNMKNDRARQDNQDLRDSPRRHFIRRPLQAIFFANTQRRKKILGGSDAVAARLRSNAKPATWLCPQCALHGAGPSPAHSSPRIGSEVRLSSTPPTPALPPMVTGTPPAKPCGRASSIALWEAALRTAWAITGSCGM